jgi:hypothetical protein
VGGKGTVSFADGFLDDSAVEQVNDSFSVLLEARIVSDHANRSALAVKTTQKLHYSFAVS